MEAARDIGALIGRILLALIFVQSGFHKLMTPAATAHMMAAKGIPIAQAALALTIFVELGCGLLLMVGYKARGAAFIIFLWLIPVTIIFHVIPHHQALLQQQMQIAMQQQANYMKNISIMGGLLMLASMGPGALSLDGRQSGIEADRVYRAA
jgi:putative oxidoreductase